MAPQKNPCLSPLHTPPLLALLLLSLSFPHLSSATDSISPTSPLSGSQKITSQDGSFVLGFFQPGNSSSSSTQKYYIGIWYNKIPQLTPVWVANRATPISDPTTSELRISANGNLVLLNDSQAQVWSTNANTTSNSTVATLLDSGNLVLRDGSNSSMVYWQSFDNPTHTWLPGGKLRLDKVTGQSQRLTSWRNSDDPAPGIFSLEIDPGGSSQYMIQWNRTRFYWSSGLWNNQTQIFSGVPEMTSNYIYSFQYVSNDQENYFTYSIKDNNPNNVTSRFIMDVSGQIKQLTWLDTAQQWSLFWSQPRAQCQVYALCGPFGSCNENNLPSCNCVRGFDERSPGDWALSDQSGGCVRNTPLQCGSNSSAGGEEDRFLTMPDMALPDSPVSLGAGSAGECAAACLNNCSCTAYSFGSGCSVWLGDLLNLQQLSDGSGGTLYLRLAASELPNSSSKTGLIAGVAGGVVVALVALVAIVWLLLWRRRRRGRMISAAKAVEGTLVSFRYSDLLRATKNFSEKLGAGGFGSVFKGMLPDSTAIAVKKLEGLHQGEKQFRSEVSTIGTIQHVNLVRLRGFCSQGTKKLLVYEHMPKGSLDTQLFQGGSVHVLDWKARYQIAVGVAKGLAYLHEQCRACIIHCDIKPENILLDASYVPKVADFGLAKLVGRDFSRVLTTMRGTRGYLAPEWISGLAITAKADVYSYGMMLFEIISGRRNSENSEESRSKTGFFPKLAAAKLMEGDVIALLDHRLGGDANEEEVTRAFKIAFWCIQDEEDSRPTMGQVVQVLEGLLEISMPMIPRSLQIFTDNPESIVFFSNLSSTQSSEARSTVSTTSQAKSTTSMSSKE